jgi:RNA polymerase sigma-70 factor (ECF subfamily)
MDREDQAPRPDQVLQAKQARALVLGALERVPLPRRAVLIMHDIDEAPMREIASVLSIRLFTAYSRLRKARKEFATAVRSLRKVSDP